MSKTAKTKAEAEIEQLKEDVKKARDAARKANTRTREAKAQLQAAEDDTVLLQRKVGLLEEELTEMRSAQEAVAPAVAAPPPARGPSLQQISNTPPSRDEAIDLSASKGIGRNASSNRFTIVRNEDEDGEDIRFFDTEKESWSEDFGVPDIFTLTRRGNNIEIALYYKKPIAFADFGFWNERIAIWAKTSTDEETGMPKGIPFSGLRLNSTSRAENNYITKSRGFWVARFVGEEEDHSSLYSGTQYVRVRGAMIERITAAESLADKARHEAIKR